MPLIFLGQDGGYAELAGLLFGRIGQGGRWRQGLIRHIGAQLLGKDGGALVSQELTRIHLRQLLEMGEDIRELLLEALDFGFAQLQLRESGDAVDHFP